MARILFDPETDLGEIWVYIVPDNGRLFALFAYVSAMTPIPMFASVCHAIDGAAITEEELRELAALIKQRGANGGWVFDGSYPWLVTPMEQDGVTERREARIDAGA